MSYLILLCTILLGDLSIKDYVERYGHESDEKRIMNGSLIIRKHHNHGVAFNIGSDRHKLVVALSSLFTCLVTVLFLCTLSMKGRMLLKTGLSLILGGAYSNTYDRIKRKYVVDYVSFGVKWNWLNRIIFNIGDFGIMLGALLVVLSEKGSSVA